MTTSIPQLPNELIEAILLRLPPQPHSRECVRALCRVAQADTRFRAVSRLSHIWQPHYAERWTRCDHAREEARGVSTAGNWQLMYAVRSQLDNRALEILDAIVTHREGRDLIAGELANDLNYDVWQALSQESDRVSRREIVDKDNTYHIPTGGLTRQYWARECLGIISRLRAIGIWEPLTNPLEDAVSFEQGLAALSAFFGQDIDKIFEEFDRLALGCQMYLEDLGLSETSDQTEIVLQICTWMRQKGFVKTDLTNHHSLLHHFPHRVLFDQPKTLPISLVYVFVCIARRLGLNASPVAFPYKVLAVVSPRAGESGESVYVDVFESATHPILSYSSDLPAMLQHMGFDPATLSRQTAPAPTAMMLLRAASNIMHSLERISTSWSEGDQMAAHYAAYCAALLLTGDHRLVSTLFVPKMCGPLDHEVILRGALRPTLPAAARAELDLYLAKSKEQFCSKDTRQGVLHFAGMLFRHRKYSYVGIIMGWDYQCEAGEEWIRRMRVEDLVRGKAQPFYNSLTTDGRSRYVAEENIQPMAWPTPSDLEVLINANRDLGRWFNGVEFGAFNVVRFLMSPETRALYPEDDDAGRAFMTKHMHNP